MIFVWHVPVAGVSIATTSCCLTLRWVRMASSLLLLGNNFFFENLRSVLASTESDHSNDRKDWAARNNVTVATAFLCCFGLLA